MIILRDSIEIKTTPEYIFKWFAHFKENYRAWHSDHRECRYLQRNDPLGEGSVSYCEEYLHGELHKLKLRITKVVPNSQIEYMLPFFGRGAFLIKSHGTRVLFTAELYFGWRIPLLGRLLDMGVHVFLKRRLEAMRQHMKEEGQNLKEFLESDSNMN